MKKIVLRIGGMTCSACSSGLEKYLSRHSRAWASLKELKI